MPYRLLLCDADETLLDFKQAEALAIRKTLADFGLDASDQTAALYGAINLAQWQALERGETTPARLEIDRFRLLLEALGNHAVQPEAVARGYADALGLGGFLMPGALEFARAVSRRMPIYLVTNGIAAIQRSRLSRTPLGPYLAGVIISQEIGSAKPDPAMLRLAMARAGVSPGETILLGDSLTSDIPAAQNAGVDSIHLCWDAPCPSCPAAYEARTLAQAQAMILK